MINCSHARREPEFLGGMERNGRVKNDGGSCNMWMSKSSFSPEFAVSCTTKVMILGCRHGRGDDNLAARNWIERRLNERAVWARSPRPLVEIIGGLNVLSQADERNLDRVDHLAPPMVTTKSARASRRRSAKVTAVSRGMSGTHSSKIPTTREPSGVMQPRTAFVDRFSVRLATTNTRRAFLTLASSRMASEAGRSKCTRSIA